MNPERMTLEDILILSGLRSLKYRGAYRAAHTAAQADAAIMAEFVNQDGYRATLSPLTLATIGLDRDDVRAIARAHWGLGEHVTMQGSEHASAPASLEHVTLESQLDWVQNPPNGIEEC